MPDAYAEWTFAQRLHWQVENKMPDFVRWIEDWLELAAHSRDVEILVTIYRSLNEDAYALVTQILEFYGIDFRPEWISLPAVALGKNNIHTTPDRPRRPGDSRKPAWSAAMSPDTLQAANAQVSPALLRRFNWTEI